MDATLEKLIAMADGQNRDDFDANAIPLGTRNKIDDALESIFKGKSILIWVLGETLGVAWNNAMIELRDQIFQISGDTPIVQYLRVAVFALRDRWNAKILQSNERNSLANVAGEDLAKMRDYANSLVETGTNTINEILNTTITVGTPHKNTNNLVMPARTMEYENNGRTRFRK